MKTQILAAIGENELQPAACLNAALAANDRVKYAFSLLQMALGACRASGAAGGHPEARAHRLRHRRSRSRHGGGRSAHDGKIVPRARRRTNPCAHRRRHALDGRTRARARARRARGAARWIACSAACGGRRPARSRRDLRNDADRARPRRQPASAGDGSAQAAQRHAGRAGRGDAGRRRRLQSGRGGSPIGRGLHERAQSHREAEILSSRAWPPRPLAPAADW